MNQVVSAQTSTVNLTVQANIKDQQTLEDYKQYLQTVIDRIVSYEDFLEMNQK